jgi:hypothetical protein
MKRLNEVETKDLIYRLRFIQKYGEMKNLKKGIILDTYI